MSAEDISITIKGPSELRLTLSISPEKTVRDLKQAISERSDVEADRQRLIYSGRVLKDEDKLSNYKIQSSHTIHMVKGVARSAGSDPAQAAPQQLPVMQAGQNPADPLTQLNGPAGHGLLAGFNPFAGTGVNTNDPNMMQGLLDSPQFMQQMSSIMSNPQVVEQVLASDPSLAPMAPQLRAMFNNPRFREMISNPESLQQMFRMSAQMRAAGIDPMNTAPLANGLGSLGAFGIPPFGLGADAGGAGTGTSSTAAGGTVGGGPTNLFNQAASAAGGTTSGTGLGTGAEAGSPLPPNPFGVVDPNLMAQLLGGYGGFGGFPSAGSTPSAPADTRPVEERFQVQLQQLTDMGFTNAQQNIRALLATGGNVHAAIEYILGGGGV
ncbi:uncharacterized protein EI90DRAFT_3016653 [Cantharellus anzutake]|uniref:uncharacterized protein n=1 Tax=Cantharellus anzutake TaxID=1750568 RepID=UPI0019054407|nr:uncharacterized protein EI90DRAFT_3016653 [Cantharellus anzutake]KAF8330824.1 hypothetical protein EI90DRAFT_3016653 [Cantharellus anzutake]